VQGVRSAFCLDTARSLPSEESRGRLPASIPVWIVDTKADEDGKREVGSAEGAAAAEGMGCAFAEVLLRRGWMLRWFCEIVRGIWRGAR